MNTRHILINFFNATARIRLFLLISCILLSSYLQYFEMKPVPVHHIFYQNVCIPVHVLVHSDLVQITKHLLRKGGGLAQ